MNYLSLLKTNIKKILQIVFIMVWFKEYKRNENSLTIAWHPLISMIQIQTPFLELLLSAERIIYTFRLGMPTYYAAFVLKRSFPTRLNYNQMISNLINCYLFSTLNANGFFCYKLILKLMRLSYYYKLLLDIFSYIFNVVSIQRVHTIFDLILYLVYTNIVYTRTFIWAYVWI